MSDGTALDKSDPNGVRYLFRPEEQGDLVKFLYGRLRELEFKEKEIRDLFGRYPELGLGGG
jgi:hypothetical protein